MKVVIDGKEYVRKRDSGNWNTGGWNSGDWNTRYCNSDKPPLRGENE